MLATSGYPNLAIDRRDSRRVLPHAQPKLDPFGPVSEWRWLTPLATESRQKAVVSCVVHSEVNLPPFSDPFQFEGHPQDRRRVRRKWLLG